MEGKEKGTNEEAKEGRGSKRGQRKECKNAMRKKVR